MQNQFYSQYSMQQIRNNEKKILKSAYNKVGLMALLLFLVSFGLGFLFTFIYYIIPLFNISENDTAYIVIDNILSILLSSLPMAVPAIILIKTDKKSFGLYPTLGSLNAKTSLKYITLGFGVFYLANYVSNIISIYLGVWEVELSQPDFSPPDSSIGVFFYFIQMTLFAGIFEELMFRGAVLGFLRKFGDRTAILISAFLFALIHGNLIQIPFAFVLGLYLGYVACRTNNLLYPILIHAVNNGVATILNFILTNSTESIANIYGVLFSFIFIALGVVGLLLETRSKNDLPALRKEQGVFTVSQKFGLIFSSPAIIVLMILCLIITANFITV